MEQYCVITNLASTFGSTTSQNMQYGLSIPMPRMDGSDSAFIVIIITQPWSILANFLLCPMFFFFFLAGKRNSHMVVIELDLPGLRQYNLMIDTRNRMSPN